MKRGKKYLEKSKLVDKANLYDLAVMLTSRLEVLLFSLTVLVRLFVSSYSLRVLRLTKLRQLVQIM